MKNSQTNFMKLSRVELLSILGGVEEESCSNQKSFSVCYNCALSGMDPSSPEWTIMEHTAVSQCAKAFDAPVVMP
ncbi:MAG TPA: hypothetical protein VGE26_11325 [Sphingobacteriaceae bacterium]